MMGFNCQSATSLPFRLCTGPRTSQCRRRLTKQTTNCCFVYEDQEEVSTGFSKREATCLLRPKLLEADRENIHPNSRMSTGYIRVPCLASLSSKASANPRHSFCSKFRAERCSPRVSRRTSALRSRRTPLESRKSDVEIRYVSANTNAKMRPMRTTGLGSNPSFVISPRPKESCKMEEYFARKSLLNKKYAEMINRLKVEEAEEIKHAISKSRRRGDIDSHLGVAVDVIRGDYAATINLLGQQRVVEEEELLTAYNKRCRSNSNC